MMPIISDVPSVVASLEEISMALDNCDFKMHFSLPSIILVNINRSSFLHKAGISLCLYSLGLTYVSSSLCHNIVRRELDCFVISQNNLIIVKWGEEEDTLNVSDTWSLPTFSRKQKWKRQSKQSMYQRVRDRSHESAVTLVKLLRA